jgi:hypothetical protein
MSLVLGLFTFVIPIFITPAQTPTNANKTSNFMAFFFLC